MGNGTAHAIESFANLTYSHLHDERLKQVTGAGQNYQLAYDAFGRTVKRTINGATTWYGFDGERPIWEGGATSASNIFGIGIDEILIRWMPTNVAFHYQDRLGSVTHVQDLVWNWGVAEKYTYDAFGQPTIRNGSGQLLTTSAINNRWMFTGREWAPGGLGFYEYRARAYHPVLGRFMSEDPKLFDGGDNNFFRYCQNDPLDRIDPMGLTDIPISPQLDRLGIEASLIARTAALNARPQGDRSVLVLRPSSPYIQVDRSGKPVVNVSHQVREARPTDTGLANRSHHGGTKYVTVEREVGRPGAEKIAAVGHVHRQGSKEDPGWTTVDKQHASGPNGFPVYMVLGSDPSKVYRLTPQLEGGFRVVELSVSKDVKEQKGN